MMNRLLATFLLAAAAAPSSWAHAILKTASPAAGATVAAGVQELRLSFNEPVEAHFCKVQVAGEDAKPVATGPLKAADGDAKTLVVPLAAAATPGTYSVHWSAMGRDGHRTKGDYRFTVK